MLCKMKMCVVRVQMSMKPEYETWQSEDCSGFDAYEHDMLCGQSRRPQARCVASQDRCQVGEGGIDASSP